MDELANISENGPREFSSEKMEEIIVYQFSELAPEEAELLLAPEFRTILAKLVPDGELQLGQFYLATEWTYKNMQFPYGKIRNVENQIQRGTDQALFYGLHEGAFIQPCLQKSQEWKDHARQDTTSGLKMNGGIEDLTEALGSNVDNISHKDFNPTEVQRIKAKVGIARVRESWNKMFHRHLSVRILGHRLGTAKGILMPAITKKGLEDRKNKPWTMAIVIMGKTAVVKCRAGRQNYYLAGNKFIKTKNSMVIKETDRGWFIDPAN